jgi:hypothetical protein
VTPRTSLCLGCRSALVTDTVCDRCDDGPVADLRSARGREAARAAAWSTSTEAEKQERRWLWIASGIVFWPGATIAVVTLVAMGVKSGAHYPILGWMITPLWMLTWFVPPLLVRLFKKTITTRSPYGAEPPSKAPHLTVSVGTVRMRDGGSNQEVVAEAFEARHGGMLMFRDAFSWGFELETDGMPILVPEGRVGARLRARDAVDDAEAQQRLAEHGLSPRRAKDIVPYDAALRWRLRPGDSVRMFANLEDGHDEDASYRQHARPTRTAVGILWLEPVD